MFFWQNVLVYPLFPPFQNVGIGITYVDNIELILIFKTSSKKEKVRKEVINENGFSI